MIWLRRRRWRSVLLGWPRRGLAKSFSASCTPGRAGPRLACSTRALLRVTPGLERALVLSEGHPRRERIRGDQSQIPPGAHLPQADRHNTRSGRGDIVSDPWFLNIVTSVAGEVLGAIIVGAAVLVVRRRRRASASAADRRKQDVLGVDHGERLELAEERGAGDVRSGRVCSPDLPSSPEAERPRRQ